LQISPKALSFAQNILSYNLNNSKNFLDMKTQTIRKAKELDPVQRNLIHEQLVKREMKFENKQVSNQFQVNPFTSK